MAERFSIEQWISRKRMESARRLGLSASDAERMEEDFDGDLRALVEWKRSRGEALPPALEGFGKESDGGLEARSPT